MNWLLGLIAITFCIVYVIINRWNNDIRDAEYERQALELTEIDVGDFPHE